MGKWQHFGNSPLFSYEERLGGSLFLVFYDSEIAAFHCHESFVPQGWYCCYFAHSNEKQHSGWSRRIRREHLRPAQITTRDFGTWVPGDGRSNWDKQIGLVFISFFQSPRPSPPLQLWACFNANDIPLRDPAMIMIIEPQKASGHMPDRNVIS